MRVLHNTLVNITNEHMGSQSVLFEGTHDVVYELKGGPCEFRTNTEILARIHDKHHY